MVTTTPRPLTILLSPESAYGPTNQCIGIGNILLQRGHRFGKTHTSNRERRAASRAPFVIGQQAQQIRRLRRRDDRRTPGCRRYENHRRRRIRIAKDPLILEPQNPSKLFFPADDRWLDRRGGWSGRGRRARAAEQKAQGYGLQA